MTLDLDALEALEKKATPGPWDDAAGYIVYETTEGVEWSENGRFFKIEDAEFVAAARNALPELIRLARIGQRVERDAKKAQSLQLSRSVE